MESIVVRTPLLLSVILLAGCASDPSPPASPTTTPSSSPSPSSSPPPSPSPPPGGIWEGFVEITLSASRASVAPGEEVVLTLAAKNHRQASVWTEPRFSCGGRWDMRMTDASGNEVRIDDRDALGCPDGGPLTKEILPGENATATYTWSGWARPQLGQVEPMPPGTYTFTGTVVYANDSATAPEDGRGSASVVVRVE